MHIYIYKKKYLYMINDLNKRKIKVYDEINF